MFDKHCKYMLWTEKGKSRENKTIENIDFFRLKTISFFFLRKTKYIKLQLSDSGRETDSTSTHRHYDSLSSYWSQKREIEFTISLMQKKR